MATVLIVDDDEMLLTLTRELLEVLGHQVFSAVSGRDALAVLDRHARQIDLVLLDLCLPDAEGLELAPEMAAQYPGLKILLCSGTVCEESAEKLAQQGIAGLLDKPYDLSSLKEALARYLPDT